MSSGHGAAPHGEREPAFLPALAYENINTDGRRYCPVQCLRVL